MPPLIGEIPQAAPRISIRTITAVIALCLATRALVWSAAYLGAIMHVRIEQRVNPPLTWQEESLRAALADAESPLRQSLLRETADFNPLIKWDSGHYRSIVETGYSYHPPGPNDRDEAAQSNIAFFPLYPLTAGALAPWLGTNLALVVVSNVCVILLSIFAYLWAAARADHRSAQLAVALLFAWPTAAFYSFAYAESMMALLLAISLYCADQRRWWWAALFAGLATAARPTAVCFAPLLLWAYTRDALRTNRPGLRDTPLIAGLSISGATAYAVYLTMRFGSPMVYFNTLRAGWFADPPTSAARDMLTLARVWDGLHNFGRAMLEFPTGLARLADPLTWNMALVVFVVVISMAGLRRVAPDFRPYLLLAPLIFLQRYLSSGWSSFGMESMSRYVGLALPTFLLLAAWMNRNWSESGRTIFLAAALLLEVAWAFHLGLGEWAG